MSMDEEMLPKIGHYIDQQDPGVVILRRQDGTFVAAFSARGAATEGLPEAAKEDHGRLIEANADLSNFEQTAPERGALRAARGEVSRA
jgi:hypothetical protein